jgi:hypothetical protein
MPKRKIIIQERALGRHRVDGYQVDGLLWEPPAPGKPHLLEVDSKLKGFDHLDTATHESLHYCFPFLSEDAVMKAGTDIAKILWAFGYRKNTPKAETLKTST